MGNKPMISVVLSFRNEEDVLPELVSRLRRVLDGECYAGRAGSYELVFVNDDSTDRSEGILLELARDHADIRIITMSRRFGISPCVLAGMEYSSGDAVVYMDADLQDPPEFIPELINVWLEGDVDVVHTHRLSRAGESAIKLWVTRIGYGILKRVSSIDLPVEAGDFKLLSRRAVDNLVRFHETNPYMRGLVCWIGFNQRTVDYYRQARFAGRTKFPVFSRSVLSNFLYSALTSFSNVPLQVSSFLGMLTSSAAVVVLLWVLWEKLQGHTPPGQAATVAAVLFLGGAQLLCIGVLGLYISSIFLETKRRPNYIVKSSFGFQSRSSLKRQLDEAGKLL